MSILQPTIFQLFSVISLVILIRYFTTPKRDINNRFKLYSIGVIMSLLFFAPIISQEGMQNLFDFHYETTIALQVIIAVGTFSALCYIIKTNLLLFKKVVIPVMLVFAVILAPDISETLNTSAFGAIGIVFHNLFVNHVITITQLILIMSLTCIFFAWNRARNAFLGPFGWFGVIFALTNAELSSKVIYAI